MADTTKTSFNSSMIFDKNKIINLLDNYQITNADGTIESTTESQKRVSTLLSSNGLEFLYKGCDSEIPSSEQKEQRQKLIEKLSLILQNPEKFKQSENNKIKLIDLLGEEGFELYKKTVKEEKNSKNFRNAVFLASTKTYKSKAPWNKRMILWIAGPSSSGKSFATDATIRKIIDSTNNEADQPSVNDDIESHVVTIDGGISREMSQMRQLVLQTALHLGYTGIEDLEKHTNIKLKSKVKDASLADDNPKTLNLAIPCTFTKPGYLIDLLKYYLAEIPFFQKLFNISGKNSMQIFSEVKGGKTKKEKQQFKTTVNALGNARAWLPKKKIKHQQSKPITINNHNIGCESKKYEPEHFQDGVKASNRAKLLYNFLYGNQVVCYEITNDLIFVIKDNNVWRECKNVDETIQQECLKLTRRQLQKWNTSDKSVDLPKWLKENNLSEPLIKCYTTSSIQKTSSHLIAKLTNVTKQLHSPNSFNETKLTVTPFTLKQWTNFTNKIKTDPKYQGQTHISQDSKSINIYDKSKNIDVSANIYNNGNIHIQAKNNPAQPENNTNTVCDLIKTAVNSTNNKKIHIKNGGKHTNNKII